jgi:hypothetical protein
MRDRALGRVDRQLAEVRAAQPLDLGVEVGEIPALQQRVMVKSMPGTTFCVQNATCSVSAKKLSTTRSRTISTDRRTGTSSSGMILVGSSTSKAKRSAVVVEQLQPQPHSLGKSPAVMASHVPRWKSGSAPLDLQRLVPHHRLQA